jgi:AhpD family alkylhydroperoxidase
MWQGRFPMRIDPYAGSATPYYEDVRALSYHLRDGPLDATLRDLVEIRVSQMTGCAFCLRLHTGIARTRRVDEKKIDTLAGWRESRDFSQQERAALELAEAMTRLGDGGRVDDPVWTSAREAFTDEELISLLYLIGLINVWNRINVAAELPADYLLPASGQRA